MNQELGKQLFNNFIKPNSQQNNNQNNQNTNVLDVLNVALKNGLNQPSNSQNSGWANNQQQYSNNNGGVNPYETNPKNNGW